MKTQEIVMFDSPEAAHFGTVEGWISRDGFFFGKDERTARYSGCTHRLCEDCKNAVVPKGYIVCHGCQDLRDWAKYDKLPREPWDGESPIYSKSLDKFFFHSDVWDYLDDENDAGEPITEESLMLVHCDPRRLHEIDSSVWEDALSTEDDSADVPSEVDEALGVLNAAIRRAGPVSWEPGLIAVQLPLRQPTESAE